MKPKIVWGEISDRSKFAYDAKGKYTPEATTFLMVGTRVAYLLCVLNCPLSEWFFSKVGTTTGVGTVRWKKYTIEELWIPDPSKKEEEKICSLVTSFVDGKLSTQEINKISNHIIYNIVKLSKEEINFVERYYPPIS